MTRKVNTGLEVESLSSWRAWIEMPMVCMAAEEICVALLMESVD